MPTGWVVVKLAGQDGVRFCSELHAGVALLGEAALRSNPVNDMPTLLRGLNGLAGTFLTVSTATPRRVRDALDRAASRVLAELDDWQRAQDRRRPGLRELLGEVVTGQPVEEPVDPDDQPMAEDAAAL